MPGYVSVPISPETRSRLRDLKDDVSYDDLINAALDAYEHSAEEHALVKEN